MVIIAEQDGLFTLPEMRKTDIILSEVYEKANAPERYKGSFYPDSHRFNKNKQDEAFSWFDKWLK